MRILFAVFWLFAADAAAQPQLLKKFVPPDGSASQAFGASVAASGDLVAIGAPNDDDNGEGAGAVYVYQTSTGQLLHKIVAPDGAPGDQFGTAVAMSGDLLLVGAFADDLFGFGNSGSAYVFLASTGQLVTKLIPWDPNSNDYFGWAVAISGNVAVVGAQGDDDKGILSGSAYAFDAVTGQQLFKWTASDGVKEDRFGASVAVSGGVVVVGAPYHDDPLPSAGAAYVFDLSTGQETRKLSPADAGSLDVFGQAVAVTGNLALVGSPYSGPGVGPGAVYAFDLATGQQLSKLVAPDGEDLDEFGYVLSVSGDTALVGAPGDDGLGLDSGSAYVVDLLTGAFRHKLLAPDGAAGDEFGLSVGISGGVAVCGSPGDDDNGDASGSAYAFDVLSFVPYGSGCPGTGGVIPELALSGAATPGGAVTIDVTGGVGGGSAFLVLGLQQAAVPIGNGCFLNVAPVLPPLVGPLPLQPPGAQGAGEGSVAVQATVPATVTPPLAVTLQAFVLDSGAPGGFSATGGVQVNIE